MILLITREHHNSRIETKGGFPNRVTFSEISSRTFVSSKTAMVIVNSKKEIEELSGHIAYSKTGP